MQRKARAIAISETRQAADRARLMLLLALPLAGLLLLLISP